MVERGSLQGVENLPELVDGLTVAAGLPPALGHFLDELECFLSGEGAG